jgi:hypothetical protein
MRAKVFPVIAAVVLLATSLFSRAETFYLQADQADPNTWTSLTTWWSEPLAGGTNAGTINGHTFFSNGFRVRTSNLNTTFGNAETILHLNSTLVVRAGEPSPETATVANLITYGTDTARIGAGISSASFTVTNFAANANTRLDGDGSPNRTLTLNIGTLTGSGNLLLDSSTTVHLSISTGVNYTGDIAFRSLSASGAYHFASSFTIAGGLIADNDAGGSSSSNRIILDQHITVGSLVLNGDSFAPGTYTASELLAMNSGAYADLFAGSNTLEGVASITVIPEPATVCLSLLSVFALAVLRRRRSASAS